MASIVAAGTSAVDRYKRRYPCSEPQQYYDSIHRFFSEEFYDLPVFATEPPFIIHSSGALKSSLPFSPIGIKLAEYSQKTTENQRKAGYLVKWFLKDVEDKFKGKFKYAFTFRRINAVCAHTDGDMAVAAAVQRYYPWLELIQIDPQTGKGMDKLRGKKVAHISDLVNTGMHAEMQINFERRAGADVQGYFHVFNVPNGGVSRIQKTGVCTAFAYEFGRLAILESAYKQLQEGRISQEVYDELKSYDTMPHAEWQIVQLKKHPNFAKANPELCALVHEQFERESIARASSTSARHFSKRIA